MANQIISKCSGLSAANDIKLSALIPNKMGGNTVYVNRNGALGGGGKLYFQLGNVDVPFGVSSYQGEDKSVEPKMSVDISFRDLDDKPKLKEFKRFTSEIHEQVILATMNGALLGVKKSREVAEELVRPTIRIDPSGKYSDMMKFNATNNTKLYLDPQTRDSTELKVDSIPKGSKCDLIVELSSVYIIGKNSLGVTYRVNQIRIKSSVSKLADYAFVPDSDDEDDSENFDGELPLQERRLSYVEFPLSLL